MDSIRKPEDTLYCGPCREGFASYVKSNPTGYTSEPHCPHTEGMSEVKALALGFAQHEGELGEEFSQVVAELLRGALRVLHADDTDKEEENVLESLNHTVSSLLQDRGYRMVEPGEYRTMTDAVRELAYQTDEDMN